MEWHGSVIPILKMKTIEVGAGVTANKLEMRAKCPRLEACDRNTDSRWSAHRAGDSGRAWNL